MATFGGQTIQHVGFGVDLNNSANWAIFSTKSTEHLHRPHQQRRRGHRDALPGSLLGSPHLYRIEWDASEVRFYVDGALVATHARATFGADPDARRSPATSPPAAPS